MPQLTPETLILLAYLVAGGLQVVLGLPLYFCKVPPNRIYGFRTSKTLRNPQTWYSVNRIAGGWMVLLGATVAGVATWVERRGYEVVPAAKINLLVFVTGLLVMLLHTIFTLRKLP